METRQQASVLDILKALADESRLALLRMVNEEEQAVGDLAQKINLGEPTVSHHLSKLREVGLVSLRMAGNQRFYRVNETGLARFKRLVAEIEQMPPEPEPSDTDGSWIAALGWEPWEQQVLREHTSGKTLIRIPSKQKSLLVVLRWLATLFQPEQLYSELEVNTILKTVYAEDFVSLRRDLVDLGYLRRERGGGKYWLAPTEPDTAN